MNLRELITELEAAAAEYGDDTDVVVDWGLDVMDIENVAFECGEVVLE